MKTALGNEVLPWNVGWGHVSFRFIDSVVCAGLPKDRDTRSERFVRCILVIPNKRDWSLLFFQTQTTCAFTLLSGFPGGDFIRRVVWWGIPVKRQNLSDGGDEAEKQRERPDSCITPS